MFEAKIVYTNADGVSKMVDVPFSIQERDIDLLILEQLHTTPSFVTWLTSKINIASAAFYGARHSVYRENGETDILLFLDTPSGRIAVMIEDKIGAAMQPQQCERYHKRGRSLCDLGEAIRYTTVLCAPRAYLASIATSERWDHRLAHEEIADWMENDLSPSAAWRRSVLRSSITKLARARQADNKANLQINGALVKLKIDCYSFLIHNYPEFTAQEQSGFEREYYIRKRGLPSGIRFKHAFFRGEISLIFERSRIDAAKAWLSEQLPDDAWIEAHSSELHVRVATEIMDPNLALAEQTHIVKQALDRIGKLANSVTNLIGSLAP